MNVHFEMTANGKRQEIEAFAKHAFKLMVAHLQKIDGSFNSKLRVDMREVRNASSWGGVVNDQTQVVLALGRFLKRHIVGGPQVFNEYDHITNPSIMGVEGSMENCIAALVAHEVAHAFDFGSAKACEFIGGKQDVHEDHGKRWQAIYLDLRETFVNNGRWENLVATMPKKTAKKRSRYSNYVYHDKGRTHSYWDGDGTLIGQLLVDKSGRVWKIEDGDKFVPTKHFELKIARREAFGF